jgi:hypothetical protein
MYHTTLVEAVRDKFMAAYAACVRKYAADAESAKQLWVCGIDQGHFTRMKEAEPGLFLNTGVGECRSSVSLHWILFYCLSVCRARDYHTLFMHSGPHSFPSCLHLSISVCLSISLLRQGMAQWCRSCSMPSWTRRCPLSSRRTCFPELFRLLASPKRGASWGHKSEAGSRGEEETPAEEDEDEWREVGVPSSSDRSKAHGSPRGKAQLNCVIK